MPERLRGRLTYANVVSTLALFLVLTGGIALAAALKKNSVKAKQIAPGAVGSSEAKDLQPGDLAFPIGASQAYISTPIDPEKNAFTTIATDTIDPTSSGTLVAVGTASIQDNGFSPGPTTLTYRVLLDGVPEEQTYTTTIADGESAIHTAWIDCNGFTPTSHTVELQVQVNFADVTVTDRSVSEIVTPAI